MVFQCWYTETSKWVTVSIWVVPSTNGIPSCVTADGCVFMCYWLFCANSIILVNTKSHHAVIPTDLKNHLSQFSKFWTFINSFFKHSNPSYLHALIYQSRKFLQNLLWEMSDALSLIPIAVMLISLEPLCSIKRWDYNWSPAALELWTLICQIHCTNFDWRQSWASYHQMALFI